MIPESDNMFVSGTNENTSVIAHSHGMERPERSVIATTVCNAPDVALMVAKIDSLKKWTVSTYKTTKQSIYENLGKVERTVDKILEEKIEQLKDLHRHYNQVLAMSKVFISHFHQMNEAQKGLAESLSQLSLKEIGLSTEFSLNSEPLRSVAHNGELLERALSFFHSSLRTLSEKTIEDTMFTICNYDQARLEYDVYRNEVASLKQSGASPETIAGADFRCNQYREKYERLKADVKVKLVLLEENRLKVMRRQLLLFHNALTAYFSGNAKALQSAVKNLNLDEVVQDRVAPSFLEQ